MTFNDTVMIKDRPYDRAVEVTVIHPDDVNVRNVHLPVPQGRTKHSERRHWIEFHVIDAEPFRCCTDDIGVHAGELTVRADEIEWVEFGHATTDQRTCSAAKLS